MAQFAVSNLLNALQCASLLSTIPLAAGFIGLSSLFGGGRRKGMNKDELGLYRVVAENAAEGVAVIQRDRFAYLNPRMEQILGRPHAEIQGSDAFANIHPDDLAMVRSRRLKRLTGQDTIKSYPFRVVSGSGETRWVNATPGLIEWQGKPALVEIYTDITENKTALNMIKEDEQRLDLAMRATDYAFFDHDLDNDIYFFSPRFFTMLGYPAEGLPETIRNWSELIHPQDRETYLRERAENDRLGGKNLFSHEFRLKNSQGGWTWILSRGRIVQRRPDGKPRRVVGSHIDITALKQVEEELRISEVKFSTVFKIIPFSVTINRLSDQAYIEVNRGFTQLFGYTRDEAIGKNSLEMGIWHDPAERELWFRDMAAGNARLPKETIFVRKDNTHFFGQITGRLVTISGEPCQMVIVEDISARKESEAALRSSEISYRLMFEGAAVGIFQTKIDGTLIRMNPALLRMLGYSSEQDAFNNLRNAKNMYVDPAQRQRILSEVISRSGAATGEFHLLRKNGSVLYVRMSIWEVTDEKGKELYLEGFMEDISEQKEYEEKVELQLNRLASLHRIDQAISASQNLHDSLDVLLNQVLQRLDVDAADVLLLDEQTNELKFTAGRGFGAGIMPEPGQVVHSNCAEQAVRSRQKSSCYSDGQGADLQTREPMMAAGHFSEYHAVPLVAKDKILGLLEIYNLNKKQDSDDRMEFLDILVGLAAIAVDNSALFEGMQRANTELIEAYDATIASWAHALELRDGDTGDHSQRVANMTVALAEAMGVAGEDLLHIRRGSLLHDIGKMSIPDRILLKPGPLDDDEWKIMRMHPVYAYEVVKPIAFLAQASEIVYCHHERWDGKGYPRGLKGEEIPLSARIFAVVDVWDALNSDRPYRPAWTKDRILREIRGLSGKQFDPDVVDIFLKMI
jgi:PAS domain S-box-containing protein/putative nucleotidyltransferase with HDIG domain